MADRAFHHDVEPSHRYPAACRGIAVDDQQPAASRCTGRLRHITLHVHATRHDVLRHAGSGIAVDGDGGSLVHAGAIVAHMTFDGDIELAVEPSDNGVKAARILDEKIALARRMQEPVDLPDGHVRKIERAIAYGLTGGFGRTRRVCHVTPGSRHRRWQAPVPRSGRWRRSVALRAPETLCRRQPN